MQCRLARCRELFEEAKQLADATGLSSLTCRCWPVLIPPLLESDALAELPPMAEQAVRDRPNSVIDRAMKCWLDARLGHRFEATLSLERLADDDFAELRHSADFLAGAAALGDACIQLGDRPQHARRIYELLEPYAHLQIALGQVSGHGAVAYHLGRLATSLANRKAGLTHFKSAVEMHLKAANPSWCFYAAYDLASALDGSGADTDEEYTVRDLAELLRSQPRAMTKLAESSSAFRLNGFSESREADRPLPEIVRTTTPAYRTLTNGDGQNAYGPSTTFIRPTAVRPAFRREDALWLIAFEERAIRIPHGKGLALIYQLLRRPGEAVHARELDRMISAEHPGSALELTAPATDTGPLLDSAAKHSYRERARELREELVEARRFNDLGRTAQIEQELQFLTRELAKAVNLFGRDRTSGSTDERARLRVTGAIKYAVAKITRQHRSLAFHLGQTIKTGFYCTYRPEVRLDWEL